MSKKLEILIEEDNDKNLTFKYNLPDKKGTFTSLELIAILDILKQDVLLSRLNDSNREIKKV